MKTKKRQAEQLALEAAAARAGVPAGVREWWDKGAAYAGPRVIQARDWAGPRFDQARDWAGPRLEDARGRGIELAAPRIEAAVGRIAPAVDATRDRIVDEVLPKVVAAAQAAAAQAAEARDERLGVTTASDTAHRGGRAKGAKAVLGTTAVLAATAPRSSHRLARAFLLLSALGAVAAAVFVVLRRRSTEVDPWAQPYPAYPPIGEPATAPAADVELGTGDDRPDDEQQPETDVLGVGTPLDGTAVPGQHDPIARTDS